MLLQFDTLDRASTGPGGCLDGGGTIPPVVSHPPGLPQHHSEVTPKQAVVERLRRRIESYRRRQTDCMPRFDQSFTGLCEQNLQDTLQLKQRYLDSKAKRVPKSKDKKQQDAIQSSVHVQQKFLKRPADDHDPGSSGVDAYEPPVKLQCTTQHGNGSQNEGLTKFHVEIVQQLEFTTSAANAQPQQISANVTVKAHTNASVNSGAADVQSPKSNPATPATTTATTTTNLQQQQNVLDVGTLVECVKQEPDNDFADLDQCAAALEKDAAANGGTTFANFSDLIGDDTNDEIMTSAAFKDLITDITTNYSDYLDFEAKPETEASEMKVEEANVNAQPAQQDNKNIIPNYSQPVVNRYNNMDFAKTELSPAAQTLKQMAEQHNKNQLGLTSFNSNHRVANARSPYHDFQFQNDYANQQQANYKPNTFQQQQSEMIIKQEMMMNDFDMKRKVQPMYKQPYSPYSNNPNAGSPNYMPRTNSGTGGPFRTNTPPRPPSGPGGGQTNANNNMNTTLQINQAQQLNINQQNHGIQVSAGQHLHLSSDSKGNVSIATQQGMHFSQTSSMQQQSGNVPSGNMGGGANMNPNHLPINQNQQQSAQNAQHMQGPRDVKYGYGSNMTNAQQLSNAPTPNMAQNAPGPNPAGMVGMGMAPQHAPDSYTMSQTQTINFTQQSLRRAAGPNPMPNQIPPPGPQMGMQNQMGPRMMNVQSIEQQKFLQQQMLRVQQQQQQQQQAAALQQQMAARPPPPDYKTSAGMMQGLRYGTANTGNMRRMPHQPMPPSGPMIRNNMYMMQQQQQQPPQHNLGPRNMYPRQQGSVMGANGGMEGMQGQHATGNSEWRHLMLQQQQQQQQQNNFGPMRNNFQQNNFNMQSNNIQMMQHQQMRQQQQQGMVGGGSGGGGMMSGPSGGQQQPQQPTNSGPMMQMNNMNQTLMTHMQQQQNIMQQQQNNAQMPMSNIHMHQSQSITVTNQMQQQQQHTSMPQLNQNNSQQAQLQQQQQQQAPPQQQTSQTPQQNNSLSNFNPTADFNFEFFDSLPTTDTTLTDQELLNSFDSDAGFNLVDF